MARTISEQTGWIGLLPVSICQDTDVLLAITEYDYDLKDMAFEGYCVSRFGFSRAADPHHFEQMCNIETTKQDFFDYWRIPGDYAHSQMRGVPQSDEKLETMWKIFNIQRGKVQDCWEIYSGKRS